MSKRRRIPLASTTTLALLLMAVGGATPAAAEPDDLLFPPDHFDGAGAWQHSGPTQVFDPWDPVPDPLLSQGAAALSTDGGRGTLEFTDGDGAVQDVEGDVAWSKSPVVQYSSDLWDVTLEMTLDDGDSFPGAVGGQVVAQGQWAPTEVYGMCTLSMPNSCMMYAVGPLYLSNDGFTQSPGSGVALAGVYGSTFCTTGSQTLNIHHPCDGQALPCTDNDCSIGVYPPPECLPENGDRVCVEQDDGSTCITGRQLTATMDVLVYEQVCFRERPMGGCVDVVAGMGTMSGFYGASGWACTDARMPLTCWTVHLGDFFGLLDGETCVIEPQ